MLSEDFSSLAVIGKRFLEWIKTRLVVLPPPEMTKALRVRWATG